MDMRSIMQLGRNILENMRFKIDIKGIGSVELTGKGLLDLHADSLWLVQVIGDGFLERRIMWEDFRHEFRFVESSNRGQACRDALIEVATALRNARGLAAGISSAKLAIIDLLVAAGALVHVAAKNVCVSREDYNKWVSEIGGDSSEKMTDEEHFADLIDAVRTVRKETYPLWSSLIALLPPGATKTQAEERLRSGCKTVDLDTGDVVADWQIVTDAAHF